MPFFTLLRMLLSPVVVFLMSKEKKMGRRWDRATKIERKSPECK